MLFPSGLTISEDTNILKLYSKNRGVADSTLMSHDCKFIKWSQITMYIVNCYTKTTHHSKDNGVYLGSGV